MLELLSITVIEMDLVGGAFPAGANPGISTDFCRAHWPRTGAASCDTHIAQALLSALSRTAADGGLNLHTAEACFSATHSVQCHACNWKK